VIAEDVDVGWTKPDGSAGWDVCTQFECVNYVCKGVIVLSAIRLWLVRQFPTDIRENRLTC
jgi:hypothetical protein